MLWIVSHGEFDVAFRPTSRSRFLECIVGS